MAKPRLDIHIGSHKTGTTAIQAALAADRQRLRSLGINYPSCLPEFPPEAPAHHRVAHALAETGWRRRLSLWRFARRIGREARGATLTLLSAEPIYRHALGPVTPGDPKFFEAHERYLERLAGLFHAFDIGIVLYLRNPFSFAESVYKENLIKVRASPLPDFEGLIDRRRGLFDYDRHLGGLRRIFPRVDLRHYEAAAKRGLIEGFYAALQVPAPDSAGPRMRISVSNRGALWLARWSGEGPPDLQRARFLYAVRDPDGVFTETDKSSLFPSAACRAAFAEQHAAALALPMFREQPVAALPPAVWTDALQARTDTAFAAWAEANRDLLARRKAARLHHFHPDPAG